MARQKFAGVGTQIAEDLGVLRRPKRGREDQQARATGLAGKLENAARRMPLAEMAQEETPVARPHGIITDIIEPDLEDSWEGELPPFHPQDVAAALSDSLSAREATEADIDVLWDAIRGDEDKGFRFLGMAPKTSAAMRLCLKGFNDQLFALEDETVTGKQLVGFVGFQEFYEGHLLTHMYLLPDARGSAPRLIPQLMAMAEGQYPGMQFVVNTADAAMARMLKSVGFQASFVLKWSPAVIVTPPTTAVDGEEPPDTSSDTEVEE